MKVRLALRRQAEMIYRQSKDAETIHDEEDPKDLPSRYETAIEALGDHPAIASTPLG